MMQKGFQVIVRVNGSETPGRQGNVVYLENRLEA